MNDSSFSFEAEEMHAGAMEADERAEISAMFAREDSDRAAMYASEEKGELDEPTRLCYENDWLADFEREQAKKELPEISIVFPAPHMMPIRLLCKNSDFIN